MTLDYQNIQLQCSDCGCEFDFSPEEQEFYSEKGYTQPKRCGSCRSKNRQRKNERRGGSRSHTRYEVICSACGINTTVPFNPTDDRPVYCTECYRKD